jgi:lipoate-protein ligase A
MTTLEAVLGRRPGFEEAARALADGFRRVHGLDLRPGGLTQGEAGAAEALAEDRYGSPEWTRGERPAVAEPPGPGRPAPAPASGVPSP